MDRRGGPFASLDELDLGADRTLEVLTSDARIFVITTFTFSVVGGALQVLHQVGAEGDVSFFRDSVVQIVGNLIVSLVGSLIVVFWCRDGRRLGIVVPTVAGAIGGAARLPFDGAGDLTPSGVDSVRVVLSSAAWLLLAGVLVRVIVSMASRIVRQRDALLAMVRSEQDSARLLADSEREFRRHVAERLHGPVQSHLIALSWRLRARPVDEDVVAEVAEEIDNLRQDVVRPLAHVLHPAAVEIGLRATFEQIVENHRALPITVEMSHAAVRLDDPSSSTIGPNVRLAVMRCIEETLNNAVLWGHATRARITADVDAAGEVLVVTCTHDGSPPLAPIVPGLGLRLVRSWAQSVEAHWELGPASDGGTSFVFSVVIPSRPEIESPRFDDDVLS